MDNKRMYSYISCSEPCGNLVEPELQLTTSRETFRTDFLLSELSIILGKNLERTEGRYVFITNITDIVLRCSKDEIYGFVHIGNNILSNVARTISFSYEESIKLAIDTNYVLLVDYDAIDKKAFNNIASDPKRCIIILSMHDLSISARQVNKVDCITTRMKSSPNIYYCRGIQNIKYGEKRKYTELFLFDILSCYCVFSSDIVHKKHML